MSVVNHRYRIRHRTVYEYSGRIDLCHSYAHLAARQDENQKTESHSLTVLPEPDFRSERKDYFGNKVHYFSIESSHKSLDVISDMVVRKEEASTTLPLAETGWEALKDFHREADNTGILLGNYILPTRACPFLDNVREFMEPSLLPGKDVMEVVHDLMSRIYREFAYTPGATETNTTLSEVMEKRKGVCQDFSHVMLAALRGVGIPARYVSGYLETLPPPGKEKLQGADASHAWIEAWAPACGWVGFDPTNNKIPGDQHIKICHGRDYFDVQPIRGIFLGSGKQTLRVEVDVERVDAALHMETPERKGE
jgi:transglutaminase-like putative cysteine protease